jgi:hypothetical protein
LKTDLEIVIDRRWIERDHTRKTAHQIGIWVEEGIHEKGVDPSQMAQTSNHRDSSMKIP